MTAAQRLAVFLRFRIPHHTSVCGRAGTEWRTDCRLFGLTFGREVLDQEWSPALTEREERYCIRIGFVSFAFSRRWRIWNDGKRPNIERGGYIVQ